MIRMLRTMALAIGITFAAGPVLAQDRVVFALNWIPYGLHYGIFAAEAQGFYREAGLDMDIQRGFGSGDTVKRVATGVAHIGMADMASLIIGRGNGLPVRQVAVVLDRSPDSIFYLRGIGINSPKDLEGRSLGASIGETPLNLLPVLAANAGFDARKIKVVNLTPPAKFPTLVSKKVDAIVAFLTEEPAIRSAASKAGVEVDRFVYSDHGVDYYSIGIIASDEMLAKRGDVVRRAVDATMRGYAWAMQNPEAAADAYTKRFPESSRALTLNQWKVSMGHMLTDYSRKHGLGQFDPQKVERTLDLIKKYQQGKAEIMVNDIYTSKYLTKVAAPK